MLRPEDLNIKENLVKAKQGLNIESERVTALKDCVFFVDREFYDAIDVGTNFIEMLAVFDLYVLDEGTAYPFRVHLNFPLKIYFSDVEIGADLVTFHINKGTQFLRDSFYMNDVNVAYQFLIKLMSGKYNDNAKLSYIGVLESFKKVLAENEIRGHDSIEFEILLQKFCVSSKDGETPFRYIAKSDSKHSEFNMINVRNVPRFESAFNAIASENINKGIIKTLNKESGINILSPLERIALSKR